MLCIMYMCIFSIQILLLLLFLWWNDLMVYLFVGVCVFDVMKIKIAVCLFGLIIFLFFVPPFFVGRVVLFLPVRLKKKKKITVASFIFPVYTTYIYMYMYVAIGFISNASFPTGSSSVSSTPWQEMFCQSFFMSVTMCAQVSCHKFLNRCHYSHVKKKIGMMWNEMI